MLNTISKPRHDESTWIKLRTLYEAGKTFTQIHQEFNIPISTIATRAKKCGWIAGNLELEIKEKVSSLNELHNVERNIEKISKIIIEKSTPDQYDTINNIINTQVTRLNKVNNIIDKAIDLNLRNIKDIELMEEVKDRVMYTNGMKLTLPEIAKMANITPNDEIAKMAKVIDIPNEPIEASRSYQDFISGK